MPVLICGETGSGKEVVARAVHERGPRGGAPLRAVSCAAMPPTLLEATLFGHEKGAFTGADRRRAGLFELADGGTVFLDEIGELSAEGQATLLRVLETKRLSRIGGTEELEVDVRVLVATHRDLEAMCAAGTFRWDLFYRINTIMLEVPPLRERVDEIVPLAERFLAEAARANGKPTKHLTPDAASRLRAYGWPGNVRELRNAMERAVVIAEGDEIGLDELTQRVRSAAAGTVPPGGPPSDAGDDHDVDFKERVRKYEVQLLLDALDRTGGNQTEAARLLRMPLRTLAHKLRAYGIKKKYDG